MRASPILAAILGMGLSALASAAENPFAGTWENRVAFGKSSYTMRLRCGAPSACEMRMIDGATREKPEESTLSFTSAAPLRDPKAARDALRYALEHHAESATNPEFAALHKLLAGTLNEKAVVDTCISLDDKQPEYFIVCTVKGGTSPRPTVLLLSTLHGLCGQGFCKHVVYPLARTGP